MKTMSPKTLLSALRRKAYHDRERLEELSRFVERALYSERKRRVSRAAKELENVADDYQSGFLTECHAEDIFQVETDFPRLQRYALFASLMGMVEANIVALCRAAHQILNTAKDFNGKGSCVILRGVKYLEDEIGADTSRFRYYIGLADNLIRVRNCITHAEGSLRNRDDAATIKAFAKDIPTLTIDERDHLALSKGFVENSTHEMHTFLDRLHDAVGKRLNVQQSASPLPRARGGHPEGER